MIRGTLSPPASRTVKNPNGGKKAWKGDKARKIYGEPKLTFETDLGRKMQSALNFSPFHLPPQLLFFYSPFFSNFPVFSPFQHGWSYRPGERCQIIWLSILDFVPQTPMWAFIVAACLSHILFFFEDQTRCFCRPELKKILHGTVELGSMTVVSNV